MKIIISPAKKIREQKPINSDLVYPKFLKEAEILSEILKEKSISDLKSLMKVSDKIAELNFNRFKNWDKKAFEKQSSEALFSFDGDVYKGISVDTLEAKAVDYLQSHLLILSGLYGVLKPMDKILPYRLEMGIPLENDKGSNLYQYWSDILTPYVKEQLNDDYLINLASKEYAKVIDKKAIKDKWIDIDFLQDNNGVTKNIAIFSKKARGLMVRFLAENNIQNLEDIKAFDVEGYYFNHQLSKENHLVFTRMYEKK